MKTYVFEDNIGYVELVDSMPTANGDKRIVDAARVSISGKDVKATSSDAKLIRYLLRNGHTSPLEHVKFTMRAKLPLFVARQWRTHRTGTYSNFNEESARYGKLADDFYIPSINRLMHGGQATDNKQASGEPLTLDSANRCRGSIKKNNAESYEEYEFLLYKGLARELARMVLPTNIYTQWYWSTDLHNLLHFLKLRMHPHAQWEIQQYACAILDMIEPLVPHTIAAWKEHNAKT